MGLSSFEHGAGNLRTSYHLNARTTGPLRALSEAMFDLEGRRCDQWSRMRALVVAALDPMQLAILESVEASCPEFEAFFAGFARTGLRSTFKEGMVCVPRGRRG